MGAGDEEEEGHKAEGEEHGVAPDIQAYYGATVRHIKHQKLKGGEIGARYQAISL